MKNNINLYKEAQMFKWIFLMLITVMVWATNIKALDVTGTVIDSDTKAKLTGVLVTVKGTSKQAITNGQSFFTISQAPSIISFSNKIKAEQFSNLNNFMVRVYSLHGNIIINQTRGISLHEHISQLKNGLYLIEAITNNKTYMAKIIVAGARVNKDIKYTLSSPSLQAKIAATGPTIEAESMTLNGYILDPQYDGVRDVIMVDPNKPSGAASTTYTGVSGVYRLMMYTCPENDGAPSVKLLINNKEILNVTYPTGANYMRTAEKIYTVDNVTLNNGDEIKIIGTSNAAAYARVDKIVLSDGLEVTLEFSKEGYITKEVDTKFGQNITVQLVSRPPMGEKPGPNNTGYTGILKTYTGPQTITIPGTIIENVSITGMLTVSASNVTIRNFKLNGGQYGIKGSSPGLIIEDGEIYNITSAGFIGSNATLRRLNIHDSGGDALKLTNNVLVEGCWIHRLGKTADAHADGNQTRSGKNLTFRGNNFDMPNPGSPNYPGAPYKSNANFIISTAVGPIDNILIEGNWLNGGNYTIYSIDKGRGYGFPTNVRVINNKFGRDNAGYPDKITARIRTGSFSQWSGNVWEDNGQPLN